MDALRDEFKLDVEWNWFEIYLENPEQGKSVSELGYEPQRWAQMMDNEEVVSSDD